MCQIMEEIYVKGEERGEARGEARGLALGIKLGEERGIKLGEERGKELGDKKGQRKVIMKFLKKMSISEVADNLDMSIEDVENIINADE